MIELDWQHVCVAVAQQTAKPSWLRIAAARSFDPCDARTTVIFILISFILVFDVNVCVPWPCAGIWVDAMQYKPSNCHSFRFAFIHLPSRRLPRAADERLPTTKNHIFTIKVHNKPGCNRSRETAGGGCCADGKENDKFGNPSESNLTANELEYVVCAAATCSSVSGCCFSVVTRQMGGTKTHCGKSYVHESGGYKI